MPNEVRNKFDFSRDIRNVCAHYKEYHFIKAHTLVLYSFIAQYLLSISVEGGMQTLLQEFQDYYDITLTPENAPIEPLIAKIPSMVHPSEFETFIDTLKRTIYRSYYSDITKFLHKITHTLHSPYPEITLTYIHQHNGLEKRYISEFPESVVSVQK